MERYLTLFIFAFSFSPYLSLSAQNCPSVVFDPSGLYDFGGYCEDDFDVVSQLPGSELLMSTPPGGLINESWVSSDLAVNSETGAFDESLATRPSIISVTYIATYDVTNMCSYDTTFTITLLENPVINNIIPNVPDCIIEEIPSFEIFASGGVEPYTYFIGNAPTVQTSDPIYSPLTPGDYQVIVEDANGCSFESSVTIRPGEQPIVSINGPTQILNNETGSFNLLIEDTIASVTEVEWYVNDVLFDAGPDQNILDIIASLEKYPTGEFILRAEVYFAENCYKSVEVRVDILKSILIEKFTNAYCGVCGHAAVEIQKLQNKYPGLIWVSHHKAPSWTDKHLGNEASNLFRADLGNPGNPLAMIDRNTFGSSLITGLSGWESRIQEASSLDVSYQYAKINVDNVEFNEIERTLTFETAIEYNEIPDTQLTGDMERRIFAMIVEDSVTGVQQHNYYNESPGHPLEGKGDIIWDYHHRNVVRTILDEDVWGDNTVVPFFVEAGVPYRKSYSYVVPEDFDITQIKVVAAYALHDITSTSNRNVVSATEYILRSNAVLTSTKEQEEPSGLTLTTYPNPATDLLYVNTQKQPSAFYIMSSQGQIVSTHSAKEGQSGIALESLRVGIYFLVADIAGQLYAESFSIVR